MAKETKSLRILSLDVENILRVVAIHIEPSGRVVELTGKNRMGKSSIIAALWMALGGKKMIPPDPIHDGAEMGKVTVKIGDDDGVSLTVTLKLKAKEGGGYSETLTLENADGARFQKPQEILNGLVGALSCDPLDFIAMKPDAQHDLLKQFVPGVDFAKIETDNKKDFDDRTVVNRDAKVRRSQAAGIVVDDKLPKERADESALVADLAGASEANTKVERWKSAKTSLEQQFAQSMSAAVQNRNRATDLKRQVDEADALAATCIQQAEGFQTQLEQAGPCPPAVDTATLQAKIAAARSLNEKIDSNARAAAQLLRLVGEAEVLEAKSEVHTKSIDDRNAAKAKSIAEADLPVEGIEFGDDGLLYYDGHPLETASQAQKLSIAIAIAAAMQPRLRFITTKNAALLDDDSWAALVNLAEERDLLIIAETVNSQRPTAVLIEDGHVKQPVAQAAE